MWPNNAAAIARKKMAVKSTVADHLKSMGDRVETFSTTITEATGVNNTLEELIANDSALVKGFGDPDDPMVKFELENFKQAIRELVIASRGVRSTIKSLAKYASNADHIQRIKEDLSVPQQDETSCEKLKSYLAVVSQRISNCRKNVEKIQPMYKKVHDLVTQHNHPPLDPAAATTFAVPQFVRRLISIGACTVGVTALALLCPLLIKYLRHISLSGVTLPSRPPDISLLAVAKQEDIRFSMQTQPRGISLQMYLLGVLCLGCGIIGLGCFFLQRTSVRRVEEVETSQQLSVPPSTMVITLRSAGVVISTFLAKLDNFKSELFDLEQSMEKAINCEDSGSIHEIEEQLQKLQVDMEAVMTIASDVA